MIMIILRNANISIKTIIVVEFNRNNKNIAIIRYRERRQRLRGSRLSTKDHLPEYRRVEMEQNLGGLLS